VAVQADYVWMDGAYVKWADAKIHVMTRALHYGAGVFEGIRAYPSNGHLGVFRLRDHMIRLLKSGSIYRLRCNFTIDELCNVTLELLKRNRIQSSAYIRPIMFSSDLAVNLDTLDGSSSTVICTFPMERLFDKPGLHICVSSWRRINASSTPPLAKACGNYINSILAKIDASANGYDDAILLDQNGMVSEGTGENIFLVQSGKLVTPSLTCSILPGITRDTVMVVASNLGINVQEREIDRAELYTSDEVFFTGSAAEVEPILTIDRRTISDGKAGPITTKIADIYRRIVRGKEPKYLHWISKV
jgi:branched-chain amino acid aminotransferase